MCAKQSGQSYQQSGQESPAVCPDFSTCPDFAPICFENRGSVSPLFCKGEILLAPITPIILSIFPWKEKRSNIYIIFHIVYKNREIGKKSGQAGQTLRAGFDATAIYEMQHNATHNETGMRQTKTDAINFRATPELAADLRMLAAADQRSVGAYCTRVLVAHVNLVKGCAIK